MSPCTGDSGFDEFEYTTRDGRLINRWRKDSGTRYISFINIVLSLTGGLLIFIIQIYLSPCFCVKNLKSYLVYTTRPFHMTVLVR